MARAQGSPRVPPELVPGAYRPDDPRVAESPFVVYVARDPDGVWRRRFAFVYTDSGWSGALDWRNNWDVFDAANRANKPVARDYLHASRETAREGKLTRAAGFYVNDAGAFRDAWEARDAWLAWRAGSKANARPRRTRAAPGSSRRRKRNRAEATLAIVAPFAYPAARDYETGAGHFVREVAHDLKSADRAAVRVAAAAMAPFVPPGATLVPVPSSRGDTSANHALAVAIGRRTGAPVRDGLGRERGESQYVRRKRGAQALTAAEQRVVWTGAPVRGPVALVDNVATTGATMRAAARAVAREGGAVVGLAWADARHIAREGRA